MEVIKREGDINCKSVHTVIDGDKQYQVVDGQIYAARTSPQMRPYSTRISKKSSPRLTKRIFEAIAAEPKDAPCVPYHFLRTTP